MYAGGPIHKSRSAKVFRYAGLLAPSILIIYGIFIQTGMLKTFHAIDNLGFLMFVLWWLLMGSLQFLFPSKTKLESFLRLTAYHLLAGSYLVFISGISSPLAAAWLLLTLASYLYFAKIGVIFNLISFLVIVVFDIILWNRINDTLIIYDLATLITITITGLVVVSSFRIKEITQKELSKSKAQESLQRDRVHTIVNNLADAVISTDVDGVIKIYNAASLNLLDTNISLKGHHIDEILNLFDQNNKEVSLFKDFKAVKTVTKRDDLNFVFKDDDKMRLEITFSPIRSSYSRSKTSNTHDGYIIIMRDITKEKSLEEERDEFVSVISHELRTPITIAEGTISNVQVMMKHPDVTNLMLVDSIKVAHQQIMFLASMVNDLSTLSRAEHGTANNTEDIDVKELANQLHSKYANDAKEKKLHLNIDLSARISQIHVSRLYLEELLQNLITNAIKYTKKGSVTIIIKQRADEITFAVKDSGIGISKSDQSKIFGKFYRSEDYRTRESSGTGLGLYVAMKLASKLGTKIKLVSRLNIGSTFSFTIPVKK